MRSTAYPAPFNKTIPADHGIVDGPTVHTSHTSHTPELLLTEIIDEPPPVLVHQKPTASCTRHVSSCSALVESRGRYSHVKLRSDASFRPHNYAGPLAGWELTKIAQFRKIDEAGNMTRPLREDLRK